MIVTDGEGVQQRALYNAWQQRSSTRKRVNVDDDDNGGTIDVAAASSVSLQARDILRMLPVSNM